MGPASSRDRRLAAAVVLSIFFVLKLSAGVNLASLGGRHKNDGLRDGGGDVDGMTDEIFELMCKTAAVTARFCTERRPRRGGATTKGGEGGAQPPPRKPPRTVSVDRIHSSHSCYGRDYGDESWQRASCQYNDVCVVPNRGGGGSGSRSQDGEHTFYYVVRTESERDRLANATQTIDVSLAPMGRANENQRFLPEVVTESKFRTIVGANGNDGDNAEPAVLYLSNVHLLYISYNAENFGHFLSDELFPAYSLLESFDLLDYDVQLVRVQTDPSLLYSCDYQRANWGELQWEKCLYRYAQMTHLMSRYPVHTLGNYTRMLGLARRPSQGVVCFKTLVAGMGMHSDHCEDRTVHGKNHASARDDCNRGRHATLYNYRNYVMGNVGLDAEAQPKSSRVVIWDRHVDDYKPKRKIHVLPELQRRIESELNLPVLLFESWHEKSIDYQISRMAESTIFVTGPGSGSYISWFLPRGSTHIRIYPTEDVYKMDWHVFNFMSHVQTEHVRAQNGFFDHEEVMALVKTAVDRYDHFLDSRTR